MLRGRVCFGILVSWFLDLGIIVCWVSWFFGFLVVGFLVSKLLGFKVSWLLGFRVSKIP